MSQRYWEYSSTSVAGQSTWLADVYPPPFTFPTSNVRAEPIRRPPPQPLPQNPAPVSSMAVRASHPPSVPHPSHPASQSSGQAILMTAQNSFVVEYIVKLAQWKANGVLPPRLVGVDRPRVNKARKQRMSEACWVANVANVNAVLDHTEDLSEVGCMCVLALAALALFESPTAVAFPALWGDGVYSQTAEVIQKVCNDLKPCPIHPPICWLGLQQMKFYFRRHIKPLVPNAAPRPVNRQVEKPVVSAPVQAPPPEPREVGGRLLRGRKVREAVDAPPQMSEKAKGKQKALAADDSQPSAPKPKTRQAKREYITAVVPPADAIPAPAASVDATPDVDTVSKTLPPPAPTRRSTRQRRAVGTPALPPPPAAAAVSRPAVDATANVDAESKRLVIRLPAPRQRRVAAAPAPTAIPTRSRSSSALTGTSGTVVDSEGTAVDETAEHENAQPSSAKALGKRKAVGPEEDAQGPPAKRARQKRPPLAVTVALAQMKGTPGVQTRARSRGAGRT